MGIVSSALSSVGNLVGGAVKGVGSLISGGPQMPSMSAIASSVPTPPPPPPPPPSFSQPSVQNAAIEAKRKAAQNAGAVTVATSPQGVQGAAMTTAKSLLGQ